VKVIATSFADPNDVAAFRKAKNKGMSDQQAFRYGDNGIGCWGDDTSEGSGPSVALPPDDMIEKWETTQNARKRPVKVTVGNKSVVGLRPPIRRSAEWEWVEGVEV
jgi:hypothetical protein